MPDPVLCTQLLSSAPSCLCESKPMLMSTASWCPDLPLTECCAKRCCNCLLPAAHQPDHRGRLKPLQKPSSDQHSVWRFVVGTVLLVKEMVCCGSTTRCCRHMAANHTTDLPPPHFATGALLCPSVCLCAAASALCRLPLWLNVCVSLAVYLCRCQVLSYVVHSFVWILLQQHCGPRLFHSSSALL